MAKLSSITKVGNVVTKRNSFGSRFMNSIGAVFTGIAVIIICLIALGCNERRNVVAIRAYDEFGKNLIETGTAEVNPANDGKLVAIRGSLSFSPVTDSAYRITADSFVIVRYVEMYQWQEKKDGSSTDEKVTYTYNEVWSSSPISSSNFVDTSYANKPWPSDAAFQRNSVYAQDAKLGDFRITPEQLQGLSAKSDLLVPENALLPSGFSLSGDKKYIYSGDISNPKVGDLRISFSSSDVKRASMLGQQQGDAIVSYTSKNGTRIDRLFPGEISGAEMVAYLKAENKAITWILRIILTVLVCIGFAMLFTPVHVLVSIIPFLGKFIGKATGAVAQFIGGILGVALSLLVIAISWIAVRPLVAIPLLLVTAGLIVLLVRYRKSKAVDAPQTAGTSVVTNTADSWTCECGHAGNTGKFCAECGKARP